MHSVRVGTLFFLSSALSCVAQPPPPKINAGSDESVLAKQAANPTAPLKLFNLREVYASSLYGVPGSGNAFVFQPVNPVPGVGARKPVPSHGELHDQRPEGRGLDNVSFFDLVAFNAKWGRWGVGPAVQLLPN